MVQHNYTLHCHNMLTSKLPNASHINANLFLSCGIVKALHGYVCKLWNYQESEIVCRSTSFLKNPSLMDINSLYEPISAICPSFMTAIWPAVFMVDKRCAIVKTVRPAISLSRASWTRYSLSASKALEMV